MQAVRRLQDKTEAAKALALLPTRQKRPTIEAKETPTSSSLLVPIDRISGSRGDTPTDRHTRARARTHTHTHKRTPRRQPGAESYTAVWERRVATRGRGGGGGRGRCMGE
jgi:hypothetical protein